MIGKESLKTRYDLPENRKGTYLVTIRITS